MIKIELLNDKLIFGDFNSSDYGLIIGSFSYNGESEDDIGMNISTIEEFINIPNLRHLDFRHSTIKKLISATGSVGMTSILANYPWLTVNARKFIEESNNNELLSKYKDICEI